MVLASIEVLTLEWAPLSTSAEASGLLGQNIRIRSMSPFRFLDFTNMPEQSAARSEVVGCDGLVGRALSRTITAESPPRETLK